MKPCRRCGETKPLTAFWKSSQYKDGHLNVCADCKNSEPSRRRGAVHEPELTAGVPINPKTGLYIMYWQWED
jgi:hypothetical protein